MRQLNIILLTQRKPICLVKGENRREKALNVWTWNVPRLRVNNPRCSFRDISCLLFDSEWYAIAKNPIKMSSSSIGGTANLYGETPMGQLLCTLHTLPHSIFTTALGSVMTPVFRWGEWGADTWNKQASHSTGKLCYWYTKLAWSQNARILIFNL